MRCKKCNKELMGNEMFCSVCGTPVTTMQSDANVQNAEIKYDNNQYYEQQYQLYQPETVNPNDKTSIVFNILGWFIPLFGIIYSIMQKKTKPKMAKSLLITSIVSIFVMPIICGILIAVLVPLISGINKNNRLEEVDKQIEDSMSDYLKDDLGDDFFNHTKKNEGNTENTAWTKYEITVNGKKVTLPCSYEEFKKKTGMQFKDYYSDSMLATRQYTSVTVYSSDESVEVSIELYNLTEDQLLFSEALVGGIKVYSYYDGTEQFSVYPGVKINMTKEQVINILGGPDHTLGENPSEWLQMDYYKNNNSSEQLIVELENGAVSRIDICCIENEKRFF